MSETESERRRRRWIHLGELIALAALLVSAAGVWISWKGNEHDGPTRIVEQRQAIPLTLRGKREDDGTRLEISPVEASHALESLTVKLPAGSPIGPVAPRSLWNYELGTRLLLGGRALVEAAAFYADIHNEFVPSTGADGLPEPENASRSRTMSLVMPWTRMASGSISRSGSI